MTFENDYLGVRFRKVTPHCLLVSLPCVAVYCFLFLSIMVQCHIFPYVLSRTYTPPVYANGTMNVTSSTETDSEQYILLFNRKPLLWRVILNVGFWLFWFMEFSHYTLASFVDNSPDLNPPRTSVIDDVNTPLISSQVPSSDDIVEVVPLQENDESNGLFHHEHGNVGCCRTTVPDCPKVRLSKMKHCPKCGALKPERCHHCSTCRQCCLKFDHHCLYYHVVYRHLCSSVHCLLCLRV